MLIPLHDLVQKYKIQFKGILHVGAHECEELSDYLRYVNINKILWVEAIPEKVALCRQNHPDIRIETAIVSNVVENVRFHISSNGQSSSMLDLGLHSHYYPEITYTHDFESETKCLRDVLRPYDDIEFNFVNLDIQGAELKALQGMEEYLSRVEYIYTEVNRDYVYENCSLVGEMDEYLVQFGLYRVETGWTDCQWGDAFYIRQDVF
jgi:FkbM family methyltransferase